MCTALAEEGFVDTALSLVRHGDRQADLATVADVLERARYVGFDDVSDTDVVSAYRMAWLHEPSVEVLEWYVRALRDYGGETAEADAVALLDDLQADDGWYHWDAVRLRGMVELERSGGDPHVAVSLLRAALDAGHLPARRGLGLALIAVGSVAEGEGLLKAAWVDDRDGRALLSLAEHYNEAKQWQDALACAESAMVAGYRWALQVIRDGHAGLGHTAVAEAAARECEDL